MIVTLYGRKQYTGGKDFLKYNTETKRFYRGNTASTAITPYHANMELYDIKRADRQSAVRALNNEGYTEFTPDWNLSKGGNNSRAVYDNIAEAGL